MQTPVGTFSGKTEDFGDTALIPAFGWVHHTRGSNFAYGIGFLGLAGFGTDYPQDSTNPILSPQPRGLRPGLLQLPAPEGADGARLEALRRLLLRRLAQRRPGHAEANPAGFASPDCSGPQGPCYFPSVNGDSAWGYGAGVGIHYKLNPSFALGASYNTEDQLPGLRWHTGGRQPQPAQLSGRAARSRLQLDLPAQAVVGLGWTPTDKLSVGIDGKWINYENAAGFKDVLGFKDIMVGEIGLQYKATDKLAVRAGYNHSEVPIPAERTFLTVEVPAVFVNHYCVGLGFHATDSLTLDLAYYQVPNSSITGPFLGATGPVPGTSVTTRSGMKSVVVTFNFALP